MSELLSQEAVETRKRRLRQVAAIAADFHDACIAEHLPADTAGQLTAVVVDYELGWVDDADE